MWQSSHHYIRTPLPDREHADVGLPHLSFTLKEILDPCGRQLIRFRKEAAPRYNLTLPEHTMMFPFYSFRPAHLEQEPNSVLPSQAMTMTMEFHVTHTLHTQHHPAHAHVSPRPTCASVRSPLLLHNLSRRRSSHLP